MYKVDIVIPPNCQNFKWSDNILLGKSNVNSDDFDTIVLSSRNIYQATIPSNIKHICPSFFNNSNIIDISISPSNQHFKWFENLLLGKSNVNSNDIDSVVWAPRNVKKVTIPSYIKYICPFCFYNCCELRNVTFSNDSELLSIGRSAFENSAIERIRIPQHVTEIDEFAFSGCREISKYYGDVVLPRNSEFCTIKPNTFKCASIRSICIPPNVTEIGECAFMHCPNLKKVIFTGNLERCLIGKNAFLSRQIDYEYSRSLYRSFYSFNYKQVIIQGQFESASLTTITIPSNVTEIGESSFRNFKNLQSINFSNDSKLRFIGRRAFESTSIEKITIPPHVTEIGYHAFLNCSKLRNVIFTNDSELQIIEGDAFESTSIETIRIPSHITEIGEHNFNMCKNFEICGISTIYSAIGKILANQNDSTFALFPSPDDGCFKWFDENLLLGKMNESDDDYDILVYAYQDVEQVTIPSCVKYIYQRCFDTCLKLKKVKFLPDSKLISIGKYAFRSTSIETITIPPHVTEICEGAFSRCSNLRSVIFPDDSELVSIGQYAFLSTPIETMKIPQNVTIIEKSAFGNCNNIKNITFSNDSKLSKIEQSAFENIEIMDYSKNRLNLPQKNPRLKLCEDGSLYGKSDENLDDFYVFLLGNKNCSKVTIPSNIKYIYPYCFYPCRSLKEIEFLPNSKLLFIGEYAFCGFYAHPFTIPRYVTKIENNALSSSIIIFENGCRPSLSNVHACSLYNYVFLRSRSITILSNLLPNFFMLLQKMKYYKQQDLTEIIVPPENHRFKSSDNLLMYKSKKNVGNFDILICAYGYLRDQYRLIPSSIKHIYPYCFFKCEIHKIEFQNNSELLSIEQYAFARSSIETIAILPHVTEICERAFSECSNLRNVIFTNDSELRIIERNAFEKTSIETITIPPHVTEIGEHAFYRCEKLLDVIFPNDSELLSIEQSVFECSSINTIKIPQHVIKIDQNAFKSCSKLQNVLFSNDSELLSIEQSVFECSSINTIKIPQHVIKIDQNAFKSCSKLQNVLLSNDSELRFIYTSAFENSSIETITIPPHVTQIGANAFKSCSKVRNVLFSNDSELRIIERNAFEKTSIETITIPPHVIEIGEQAFFECHELRNVVFSNDSELQIIGKYAFAYSSIETITIPPHVTKICERAFSVCLKLRNVIFTNDSELRIIERNAFEKTSIETITIPCGTSIGENAFSSNIRVSRL